MSTLRPTLHTRTETTTRIATPNTIRQAILYKHNHEDLAQEVENAITDNPLLERYDPATEGESEDADVRRVSDDVYYPDQSFVTPININMESVSYATNDFEGLETPLREEESLIDHLTKQISTLKLTPDEFDIAHHIICSLDDNGYLDSSSPGARAGLYDRINHADNSRKSTTLQSYERLVVHAEILRGQFAASGRLFEFDDIMRMFKLVRSLDPVGIATTSSAENMMMQLEHIAKETKNQETKSRALLAYKILDLHKNLLENNRIDDLCAKLKITREEFREVLGLMRKLRAHPAADFNTSGGRRSNIIPDFFVENNDGRLEVRLFYTNKPNLRIKQEMLDKLTQLKLKLKEVKKDPALIKERNYLTEKIKEAASFIDSLNLRFNTLSLVMRTIVEYQRDFFLSGDWSDIKPMVLERIAEKTGLDVSTVSRVASTKYVQTEFGIFKLRRFFSESIKNNEGQDVSTTAVKELVRDLIASENPRKPMSDDMLCKELENRGLQIARRTVAKYRESMGIPVARLRKK